MVAVIDYGVGNLFSLQCSLCAIGQEAVVTTERSVIAAADRIILPGVGAFHDAAQRLRDSGMAEAVLQEAGAGKPLLGICLGMQLLFEESLEYGRWRGLGLLRGTVRPIAEAIPAGLKIPHIGWNALRFCRDTPLLGRIRDGNFVYFVHSYYAADCGDSVAATTDYGAELTAVVARGSVMGCQFHPEKSGRVGLEILRAFCEDV